MSYGISDARLCWTKSYISSTKHLFGMASDRILMQTFKWDWSNTAGFSFPLLSRPHSSHEIFTGCLLMTWPVLDESYIGFGMDAKTSVGVMIPKCTQRVHISCETVTSRYTSYPLQRREVFPPHTFLPRRTFSASRWRGILACVTTIASELSHLSLIFAWTEIDNANFFQV